MASDALKRLAKELALPKARRALPAPQERKRLRVEAGLSQERMADVLDCSRAAVSRFEHGRDPRDAELVNRYRAVLNRLSLETADEHGDADEAGPDADRAAEVGDGDGDGDGGGATAVPEGQDAGAGHS